MKATIAKATASTARTQADHRRSHRRCRAVVAGVAFAIALTTAASASSQPSLVAINFGNSTGGDG